MRNEHEARQLVERVNLDMLRRLGVTHVAVEYCSGCGQKCHYDQSHGVGSYVCGFCGLAAWLPLSHPANRGPSDAEQV